MNAKANTDHTEEENVALEDAVQIEQDIDEATEVEDDAEVEDAAQVEPELIGESVDRGYVARWARRFGVLDVWEHVLAELRNPRHPV